MFRNVASSRMLRVVALGALVILMVLGTGSAAMAVEATEGAAAGAEEEHAPQSVSDIGTQNEVSDQYRPEPTELPLFQRWLYVPLFLVGVIVILMLLFRNLQWQPRFAEERRSKRRR